MRALVFVCLVACAAEKPKKPLYIGLATPQSGALVTGDLYTNSANLALKHINDDGGLRGDYALTLAIKETNTTAAGAAEAMAALIQDNAIKAAMIVTSAEAIVGDGSGGYVGAAPTAAAAKVPVICIGCAAPDFDCVGLHQVAFGAVATGGSADCEDPLAGTIETPGYFYRTVESSAAQGAELAQMAIEDGRSQHAGVGVNMPFGTTLLASYSAGVSAQGASYVRTATHEQSAAALARAQMSAVSSGDYEQSVKTSYDIAVVDGPGGPIDALVVSTFPDYARLVATAFEESSKRPALYFSFAAFSSQVLASSAALLGAKGVNYAIAGGPSPGSFVVDYAAAGNVAEDQVRGSIFVDGAYDAVMLMALAIYATGEEDPSPEAVKAKLDTLNDPAGERVGYKDFATAKQILDAGGTINYDGVSGELDWSANKLNAVRSRLGRWQVVPDGANLTFKSL